MLLRHGSLSIYDGKKPNMNNNVFLTSSVPGTLLHSRYCLLGQVLLHSDKSDKLVFW